jgi:hypothetical protein
MSLPGGYGRRWLNIADGCFKGFIGLLFSDNGIVGTVVDRLGDWSIGWIGVGWLFLVYWVGLTPAITAPKRARNKFGVNFVRERYLFIAFTEREVECSDDAETIPIQNST